MRDDSATVHCNFSTASYHLVCDGNQWVGQVRNCSQGKILLSEAYNMINHELSVRIAHYLVVTDFNRQKILRLFLEIF